KSYDVHLITHAHRVAGDLPAAPAAACAAADVCPSGSRTDSKGGCVATEPIYDASTPPVSIKLQCFTSPCAMTDVSGTEVWGKGSPSQVDVRPGRYVMTCGGTRTDVLVHPKTPMAF